MGEVRNYLTLSSWGAHLLEQGGHYEEAARNASGSPSDMETPGVVTQRLRRGQSRHALAGFIIPNEQRRSESVVTSGRPCPELQWE